MFYMSHITHLIRLYCYVNHIMVTLLKFQREQVDAYCRDRNDTGAWPLDRLMIWNKENKTAFCYVPKGGCISLLLMFMTKKGI